MAFSTTFFGILNLPSSPRIAPKATQVSIQWGVASPNPISSRIRKILASISITCLSLRGLYLPPISPGKTGFFSSASGALLSAILASLPPDFLLVIIVI